MPRRENIFAISTASRMPRRRGRISRPRHQTQFIETVHTAHVHNEDHKDTPTAHAHAAREPQRARRNRRAQCAGARQQRACAMCRGRESCSGLRHASRERAPKTGAKAPCIGRKCAERRLQGRRSAAPPPLERRTRSEAAQKMPEPRALFLAASRAAEASLKAPIMAWSPPMCAPGTGARSSFIGARSLPANGGEARA